jgi:broad specificity phosphatase PhoE
VKLYLIRHLPTNWNKSGLLQGKRNIAIDHINESDESKILNNTETLKNKEFDLILTSSLTRTKQTAIEYGYKKFEIEPLLDELDFGIYEGKHKSNLIKASNGLWISNPSQLILGESLADFESRLRSFLISYSQFNRILVFSHGAVIRALVSIKNNNNIDAMNKITVNNNSITII